MWCSQLARARASLRRGAVDRKIWHRWWGRGPQQGPRAGAAAVGGTWMRPSGERRSARTCTGRAGGQNLDKLGGHVRIKYDHMASCAVGRRISCPGLLSAFGSVLGGLGRVWGDRKPATSGCLPNFSDQLMIKKKNIGSDFFIFGSRVPHHRFHVPLCDPDPPRMQRCSLRCFTTLEYLIWTLEGSPGPVRRLEKSQVARHVGQCRHVISRLRRLGRGGAGSASVWPSKTIQENAMGFHIH